MLKVVKYDDDSPPISHDPLIAIDDIIACDGEPPGRIFFLEND
jgi:hypothetical protein